MGMSINQSRDNHLALTVDDLVVVFQLEVAEIKAYRADLTDLARIYRDRDVFQDTPVSNCDSCNILQ